MALVGGCWLVGDCAATVGGRVGRTDMSREKKDGLTCDRAGVCNHEARLKMSQMRARGDEYRRRLLWKQRVSKQYALAQRDHYGKKGRHTRTRTRAARRFLQRAFSFLFGRLFH